MFSFLSKLNPRDKLVAAARHANRHEFIDVLGFAEIWIPTANKEKGLDASNATDEEIIDYMENTAKSIGAAEEFQPLIYEDAGCRRLPFFSKRKYTQTFAGEFSKRRNTIQFIHFVSIDGLMLGGFLDICEELVMNDMTKTEFCLTERDKKLQSMIWNELNDAQR